MGAIERRQKQAAEDMAKNLASHEVFPSNHDDASSVRSWLCRNMKNSNYYFHVTTWPGWLVIAGDVGFLALSREQDMIAWARKAVDDPNYIASKSPTNVATKEFDEEIAKEWVANQMSEGMSFDLAVELLQELDEGRHAFEQALYDSGHVDCSDFPNFLNFTHDFLRCLEALKWLLARI